MSDPHHRAGQALDRCICVYAEQNAFIMAARYGIHVDGATLYTTQSPCFSCLKEAIQAGVVRVVSQLGLKRRRVVLMIILFIVTFGWYYPIWFVRRRVALNRLDTRWNLRRWPFLIWSAFWVLEFIMTLATGSAPPETIGAGGRRSLLQLAVGILMVVQCFFVKDILEDHFGRL
jgi:cytidine/deoxycytidylate deaminase-like protein